MTSPNIDTSGTSGISINEQQRRLREGDTSTTIPQKTESQSSAGYKSEEQSIRDLIESVVGSSRVKRTELNAGSSHESVAPYLPSARISSGKIYAISKIQVDASNWPRLISWSEPNVLSIRIQNPADSGQDVAIGIGASFGTLNAPSNFPFTLTPGQEWVGDSGGMPIFCKTTTANTTSRVRVIVTRGS